LNEKKRKKKKKEITFEISEGKKSKLGDRFIKRYKRIELHLGGLFTETVYFILSLL